mmetsp:Transcript_335/g.1207  ORF Transcript_335/g.1207 Transcript_335/m.1207 type:complete len:996 (-) Transcript_335:491-3478(-)|eukprot:CAMPEP_0117436932 /NCGR_PEP_ID=MMETSP0759-20121206/1262_1 /TAXON_ID=63605 /ORGANISM="Percolomonas cosmopolitus, Strain WS" /LENGTH=995 /DNA_ID=CAMNT_0005228547 /DNA_START=216 /DNA_END=3203 /DNA_ORIENTATION=-
MVSSKIPLSQHALTQYVNDTLHSQLNQLKVDLIQISDQQGAENSQNSTHQELINALELAIQNTETLIEKLSEIGRKWLDGALLESDEWDLLHELGFYTQKVDEEQIHAPHPEAYNDVRESQQERDDGDGPIEDDQQYTTDYEYQKQYRERNRSSSPIPTATSSNNRYADHTDAITSSSYEEDEVLVEKSSHAVRTNADSSQAQSHRTSPPSQKSSSQSSQRDTVSPKNSTGSSYTRDSVSNRSGAASSQPLSFDDEDEGSPPLHAQEHVARRRRNNHVDGDDRGEGTDFTSASPPRDQSSSPLSTHSTERFSPKAISKSLNTSFTFHNEEDMDRLKQEFSDATMQQQQQAQDYENRIAQLEACLEDEVSEKVKAMRHSESLITRMKDQEHRWQQTLKENEQTIQQQSADIAFLREQLQQQQQQQDNPQVDESLATILDDMKKGAAMLQNQFTESFSFERNRLLEELNRTKSDLLYLQQSEENREREVDNLRKELHQRTAKLQQLQESSKQNEHELSDLRDEIDTLNRENTELRSARKDTGSLTFSLNRKIQSLEETIEQLKAQRDIYVQKYLTDSGINLFDTVLKGETQVLREYIQQMKKEMEQRSTSVNKDMQKLKGMVGKITDDATEPLSSQREKQETMEQMLMDLEKFHTYRPEYRAHANDPVDKLVCETLQSINTGHVKIDMQRISEGEYMIDRPFRVRIVNDQPVIRIGSAYTPLRDYLIHLYAPYLVSSEDMHTSAYRESYDLSKHYVSSRAANLNSDGTQFSRSRSTPAALPLRDTEAPQRGASTNTSSGASNKIAHVSRPHSSSQDDAAALRHRQETTKSNSTRKPDTKRQTRTRTPARSSSRSPKRPTTLHTKHTRSSRAQIKRSSPPVPSAKKSDRDMDRRSVKPRGNVRRRSPKTARQRSLSRKATPLRETPRASSNPKTRGALPMQSAGTKSAKMGKIAKPPPALSTDIQAQLQNAKNMDEAQIKQLKKLALKQQIEMMRQRK